MGRPSKIDKRKLIGMLADNFNDAEIARKLGVSRQAVSKCRKKLCINAESEPEGKMTQQSIGAKLAEMANEWKAWLEIRNYSDPIKEVKTTMEIILDWLERRYGLDVRDEIISEVRERLGHGPLLIDMRRPTETGEPGEPGSHGDQRVPGGEPPGTVKGD